MSFIAVRRSGRRSCRPLIATTLPIRARTRSGRPLSAQTSRATRWPPAEWPARCSGPGTAAAASATAAVTERVIAAIRTSGASG